MKINEKIKALRKARGWNLRQFGELMNPPMTPQAVYQIESGDYLPTFERMEDIARVFGLENKYLTECG